jgi:hypothetical protein
MCVVAFFNAIVRTSSGQYFAPWDLDNPRCTDGLAYKNFYGLTWNEFVGWVLILPLNHGSRSNFVNWLILSVRKFCKNFL